jgi:transglutaminase-like putative cysteine protease
MMVRPRESRELRVLEHTLSTAPEATLTWSRDVFDNDVATARFQLDTDALVIESNAEVELSTSAWPIFDIDVSAMSYPFSYSEAQWLNLRHLATRQYPDVDGSLESWTRGFIAGTPTDTLSLLKDLNMGVHSQIAYQSRDDEGTQAPAHTLARGWGSCRDLAVLMAEAARALGFGARLASGYLVDSGGLMGTSGSGSTHLWTEIFIPGPGWIAFDPTNATMGGAHLVPTAVVRDISQAVPISGSFVDPGNAFVRMDVEVDVADKAPNSNHESRPNS